MKRAPVLVLLAFLLANGSSASPELSRFLQRAKEQFRLAAYDRALQTLGELEAESAKPGLERDRAVLEPVVAFYRGACLAALGRRAEALADFQRYLAVRPNSSLDPALYPKKVVVVFEEARKRAREGQREGESESDSFAAAYRESRRPEAEAGGALGEDWTAGPVGYLLTAEEKRDYEHLLDSIGRSEFVTAFWKSCDPSPETPENEFREEFEKRVAFADARLTQGETRGSLTDRGMVFLLLGPPTYVGRKPLTSGEDRNEDAALSLYRTSDVRIASVPGGSRSAQVARVEAVTGPGTRVNEAASNWREVWHYRRESLPAEVPYFQVDFEFLTKRGYGENILQRESSVVYTLEKARHVSRRGGNATNGRGGP